MTFTPGSPFDGQSLGSSKTQVRGNFTNYFNWCSQDHVPPNSTGEGKHANIHMVTQMTSPATNSTEIATYAKTITGVVEWFMQKSGHMAGDPDIQVSSGTVVRNAFNAQGFFFGGFQFKCGNKPTGGTGTSIPVIFTTQGLTAFPTACVVAFAIGNNNGRIYNTNALLTTQFTVQANTSLAAPDNFFWFAVGY